MKILMDTGALMNKSATCHTRSLDTRAGLHNDCNGLCPIRIHSDKDLNVLEKLFQQLALCTHLGKSRHSATDSLKYSEQHTPIKTDEILSLSEPNLTHGLPWSTHTFSMKINMSSPVLPQTAKRNECVLLLPLYSHTCSSYQWSLDSLPGNVHLGILAMLSG